MGCRGKLFLRRDPYNREGTEELFVRALRENAERCARGSEKYREMLERAGFEPKDLRSEGDIASLPPIPTLYFKRNELFSVPERRLVVRASSSGTKGQKSRVGLDASSLLYGLGMMYRFFRYHGVVSLRPTNYIVVGYEPSRHADTGAIKTAYGTTKFAPALHREYALKDTGEGYEPNPEGVRRALFKYAKQPFPVRFVGFPAYLYLLVKTLEEEGVSLKLPRGSAVLLGGGWKEFSGREIGREEFLSLIEARLGIPRERVLEFYSAVEHPHAYVKCECGNFHVPLYTRAFTRDCDTLEPLEEGEPGLLNFVTPLVSSMPLLSVLTDDIAVCGSGCACGNKAPFFRLLGRAGAEGIKTCTAEAAELMRGAVK